MRRMKGTQDPLFYGEVSLNPTEDVKFHSGDHVTSKLESLVNENRSITGVILSTDKVLGHFSKVFPEVLKSNKTGQLTEDSFALWEKSHNDITIGLDTGSDAAYKGHPQYDVYIGGPASAVAAALHAKSGKLIRFTMSSVSQNYGMKGFVKDSEIRPGPGNIL